MTEKTHSEGRSASVGKREAPMRHANLLYMMHELSRLISTHFDHVMHQHQLTHGQWWALMHISGHAGATQTELAAIMQMGRASTGKVLERLEAKGWIIRRPDESDHRVRRVYVSESSEPVFKIMQEEGAKMFDTFLAGIDDAEERQIMAGLGKLRMNAERALGISQ